MCNEILPHVFKVHSLGDLKTLRDIIVAKLSKHEIYPCRCPRPLLAVCMNSRYRPLSSV